MASTCTCKPLLTGPSNTFCSLQARFQRLVKRAAIPGPLIFRLARPHAGCNRSSNGSADQKSAAARCCSSSLAEFKIGNWEEAIAQADSALQLLQAHEPKPLLLLARAFHRKAEAQIARGKLLDALKTYRRGLAECRGLQELHAAARLAAEQLPASWLARYWAGAIEAAQAPNPLSSRDGRLIKPVPPELRLPHEQLVEQLTATLQRDAVCQEEARDHMVAAWAEARRPGRAAAAFFRGAAYLRAGDHHQALKDARVALVYGLQQDNGSGPAWAAGHALQAAALEAAHDNVAAALAAAQASELDPDCEQFKETLERLLPRIPEVHAAALRGGGSAGLQAALAADAEASKPEFLRQRPKYYYYYEWMKKRIAAQCRRQLPEPVMDKLLTLEAGELDLILQYPAATQQTVNRLLDVYEDKGGEYLETYRVPLLTWEQTQELAAQAAAAALPPAEGGPRRAALAPAGSALDRAGVLPGGLADGKPSAAAGSVVSELADIPEESEEDEEIEIDALLQLD